MATQLAEAPDAGGEEHNDNEVNYEAEARKLGWKPAEEFNGDPSKHVDAETFYKRGQEMMPILKAQNRELMKRLDKMERDSKRAAEFFSRAEERAYDRAREDLKREMAEAVEAGDTKAADAVMDKLDKLEKPGVTAKPQEVDPAQRAEEFADWGTRNPWYATNDVMRIYADAQADTIARSKNGVLDKADLDEVAERVRAKFSDTYPEAFGGKTEPRTQKRSPVDGGGSPPPRRGGRTFADLPAEAQRMCDKWVASGIIKSRDDYVKSYDFGDKK